MQTTFMEAISITVSSMVIVLATLSLIAIILSSFKFIFKSENHKAKTTPVINKVIEDDGEEKIVAALVTSIIAAEQAQHTNFHVRSIKRVK